MANRREIKKDVQFIAYDFIDECIAYTINHPGEKDEAINKLIDEAVDMYDDLMHRINNHSGLSKAEVKQHFSKIYGDLEEKSITLTKAFHKTIAA